MRRQFSVNFRLFFVFFLSVLRIRVGRWPAALDRNGRSRVGGKKVRKRGKKRQRKRGKLLERGRWHIAGERSLGVAHWGCAAAADVFLLQSADRLETFFFAIGRPPRDVSFLVFFCSSAASANGAKARPSAASIRAQRRGKGCRKIRGWHSGVFRIEARSAAPPLPPPPPTRRSES